MEATDVEKTAKAQEETYRRYLELHQERAEKAEFYLRMIERRETFLGEIKQEELIDAWVRRLIDLKLKKHPAMDLAVTFMRAVIMAPVEMRVPMVNAIASCCEPSYDDNNWAALRKKLHALANKIGGLLYELNLEFADWQLKDPAQQEMFKPPVAVMQPAGQVQDDGGVLVNTATGEVREA